MSNYLAIVHHHDHTEAIDTWLRRHSRAEDTFTASLDHARLVIVSKDVRASISGNTFFRGSLLTEDGNALVFGIQGWDLAPPRVRHNISRAGGEFILADWSQNELHLTQDVFGGVRMAYTKTPGLIAASDSLLTLVDLRRITGHRNKLNHQVAIARMAKNSVAGQQFGPQTLVDEIRYVPAGFGLRQHGPAFSWRLSGGLATPTTEATVSDADAIEALRTAATNVARTVRALSTVPRWQSQLSLSGGQDSRTILAAAIALGLERELLIHTAAPTSTLAADYEVAMRLIERYNLTGAPGSQAAVPEHPIDPATLWAASLLGLYDGFGPQRTYRTTHQTFGLTGIGAELYKGNWGWKTVPELAADAAGSGPERDALAALLYDAAGSIRADPLSRNASELIYLGYRNGIHGSNAHIGIHMTGIHPVMQLPLAQAAHMRTASGFAGSPRGITDITLLLSPALAVEPHEDSRRDITRSYAEARLAELGGPVVVEGDASIYGDPSSIVDGPSSLSLSIARAAGFSGGLTANDVFTNVDNSLSAIGDPTLKALAIDLVENTKWRLQRHRGDIRSAGTQPARVRALDFYAQLDG